MLAVTVASRESIVSARFVAWCRHLRELRIHASGTREALVPNQRLLLPFEFVHLVTTAAATTPGQPTQASRPATGPGATFEAGDLRS